MGSRYLADTGTTRNWSPLLAFCGALLAADARAQNSPEDAGCVYIPHATPTAPAAEVTTFAKCGSEKDDGTAAIRPEHLAALDFGKDGLASIRVGEHFYYFRPDGRSARVPTWDNWADDFAEGLVRTVRTVDGVEKVGYLDGELSVVIAPRFDWGFPFAGGRALVCIGCRPGPPDDDGHSEVSGGLWGYVDKTGQEVVPVKSSRDPMVKLADRP